MAYGAAQWHIPRQAQFNEWSAKGGTDDGHDIRHSSLEEQMRFIDWDLTQGKYKGVGDHMRAAKTLEEKVRIFDEDYESPADKAGAVATDIPVARQWQAQQATGNGRVDVHVRLTGAPPGTTAVATSDGSAAVGGVRVERAMK
jgi:hypothetical protein